MKTNKGFTLVELLVVIMILGILMAIIIPAVTGALSEGQGAKCLKNLQSLNQSAFTYASKFGGSNKNFPIEVGKAFWKKLCTAGTNVLNITDGDYTSGIFHCAVRQTSGNEVKFRGPGDAYGKVKSSDPIGCDDDKHLDKEGVDSGSVLRKDGSVIVETGAEWTASYGKCKD